MPSRDHYICPDCDKPTVIYNTVLDCWHCSYCGEEYLGTASEAPFDPSANQLLLCNPPESKQGVKNEI